MSSPTSAHHLNLPEPNWSRMVRPHKDEYDTDHLLALAVASGWDKTVHPSSSFWFDGCIAVAPISEDLRSLPQTRSAADILDIPYDFPTLPAIERLVATWPEGYQQVKRLIQRTHVGRTGNPTIQRSWSHVWGVVSFTVDDPVGGAEALVHEMAHLKLTAMGCFLEQAFRFLHNDPTDLYQSPVLTDRQRPMTAVLHATYAWMHILALDLTVMAASAAPDTSLLARAVANNQRVRCGLDEITRHAVLDSAGQQLICVLQKWAQDMEDTVASIRAHSCQAP